MTTKCTLFILLVGMLMGGCGSKGYRPENPADIPQRNEQKIAEMYYKTQQEAVKESGKIARELAKACVIIGEQVGKPLAPSEAVQPRTEVAINGTGKLFDISKNTPPEELLPLAKERTKQIQAIAFAVHRTSELSHVDVAAPKNFKFPADKSLKIPTYFDLEPEEEGDLEAKWTITDEKQVVEDYEEVRKIAKEKIKKEDEKH